jgi:hypothetical protein
MVLHYELTQYVLISFVSLALLGIIAAIIYAGHSHKS